MTLPDYQFNLYSIRTGDLLAIYDAKSAYEVKYSRILNDVGVFAMTLAASAGVDQLFELDNLLEVLRTSPVTGQLEVEETYLIRITDRMQEDDYEFFVVGGVSLNHLLARRIVDPDDDPAAAGGYSTKAGPADTVLRAYADEQCGASASADRQFPNFTVNSVAGVGQGAGARLRHENLLNEFQKIASRSGIDFAIRRVTANQLELNIGTIGTDRTMTHNYPFAGFVLLDPRRGNLSGPHLRSDRKDEANYAYIKAQGPGDTRIVFEQAGGTTGDSPLNRIEFAADARSSSSAAEILTSAQAELAEREPEVSFDFDLSGDEPGNTYRQDWDLGDLITARWDAFIQDLRVTEVTVSLQGEKELINVKVEQP